MWLHGINGKSMPGSASWVPARPCCCCCCAPRALPNFLHPLEWPRTAPRPCTPGQPLKSGKGGILASTQPSVRGCRQRAAAAGGSELFRGSDGAESPWDERDEAEPRPLHLPSWLWMEGAEEAATTHTVPGLGASAMPDPRGGEHPSGSGAAPAGRDHRAAQPRNGEQTTSSASLCCPPLRLHLAMKPQLLPGAHPLPSSRAANLRDPPHPSVPADPSAAGEGSVPRAMATVTGARGRSGPAGTRRHRGIPRGDGLTGAR